MKSGVSRRDLIASGIAAGAFRKRAEAKSLLASWEMSGTGEGAFERIAGIADPVSGRGKIERADGPHGRSIRFDGYSTWITRQAAKAPHFDHAFTIDLWTAMETYPVADAALVNQRRKAAGYSLGLSPFGFWGLGLSLAGTWIECVAPLPLPKNKWLHLAAIFDPAKAILLYLDGALVQKLEIGAGLLSPAWDVDLLIGRHNESAFVANGLFPTGVVNGLMSAVCIHGRALKETEVRSRARSARALTPSLAIPPGRFADDPYRPRYHAKPAAAWTNEPHGLIHWNGAYHLWYQKNANGPYWGQIHWGHMQSPDLVHWSDVQIALAPEPGLDQKGCWSGSVIVHRGTPAILYTAANGVKACICLATSRGDLLRWTKYRDNPVIPSVPTSLNFDDFRDPFVFEESGQIYAVIGSGVKGKGGAALLYKTTDLIHWTFLRPLLLGNQMESGTFWEMPIFVPMGGRHVLIVTEVPGRSSYWVGTWKDETFTPDEPTPRRLDLINHFLSPTPMIDDKGGVTVMGISPDTRASSEAWRAGWVHVYGLPRVLSLHRDGTLRQEPTPLLNSLRKTRFVLEKRTLKAESLLLDVEGNSLEIIASFAPAGTGRFGLSLCGSPGLEEETLLFYDSAEAKLTLDRRRLSLNPAVQRTMDVAPFNLGTEEPLVLHIFVDRSILDVFLCGGRGAFTSRIYPTRKDSTRLRVFSESGGVTAQSIEVWQLDDQECVA